MVDVKFGWDSSSLLHCFESSANHIWCRSFQLLLSKNVNQCIFRIVFCFVKCLSGIKLNTVQHMTYCVFMFNPWNPIKPLLMFLLAAIASKLLISPITASGERRSRFFLPLWGVFFSSHSRNLVV